jgi:hypothetical protein
VQDELFHYRCQFNHTSFPSVISVYSEIPDIRPIVKASVPYR